MPQMPGNFSTYLITAGHGLVMCVIIMPTLTSKLERLIKTSLDVGVVGQKAEWMAGKN